MSDDSIEVRGEVEIVHLLNAFAAVDVAFLCPLSLCLSLSLSLLWFKLIRSFSPPGSFGFGVLIERDEEKAMVWCRFGYATWVLSFVEKNYNKLCFLIWVFWI
jgi:hypothetical protein